MLGTLKALADQTRLRLLHILSHGEFTVQELTRILDMGQSRISRHLRILMDEGILSVKRQGTWSYYRLSLENALFCRLWPEMVKGLDSLDSVAADHTMVMDSLDRRRQQSQDFFNQHAREWDSLAADVFPVADYLELLVEQIPTVERLLEVGIGTGRLLRRLEQKARQVVGVDHSPAMVEQARVNLAASGSCRVEIRLGDMNHLPVPDGEIDCAVFNMVLHHAAQPGSVFAEVSRVLARGGTLVIADLARHEKEWVRDRLADQWLGFDQQEIVDWLARAGFEISRQLDVPGEPGDNPAFILTAVKKQ